VEKANFMAGLLLLVVGVAGLFSPMVSDSGTRDTGSRDAVVRDKVRAILERANHPNTPQAEAETALALAYRLMQKHGIDESEVAGGESRDVVSKTMCIAGPYRVRRSTLFHIIATHTGCATYRDMETGSTKEVTMVAFGSTSDLFALETLYAAAEMLALRSMPAGDRTFRTAWWHGFCAGVDKKLAKEMTSIIVETPGAGLVLLEKKERATFTMRSVTPRLSAGRGSYVTDRDAYTAGREAGSRFSTGSHAMGGQQRALGPGRRS
jgi:hypothetical protein